MLTDTQAKALDWGLTCLIEQTAERAPGLQPDQAVEEICDLASLAELLPAGETHDRLTSWCEELRVEHQARVDDLPPVPGALMPTFEAALKAWGDENREPVISPGAILLWRARRAVYAALWFVENVGEDAPDRQDIFFKVREIAGDAR